MTNRKATQGKNRFSIKINTTLTGDPAIWYYEWKRRDIVKSTPDALLQAFQTFQKKLTEFELKRAQAETEKSR